MQHRCYFVCPVNVNREQGVGFKNMGPCLPFESAQIRRLRVEVQKPYHREELWAWLVLRRFSIYLTLAIARITPITPNRVTVSAVFLGLIGACVTALLPTVRDSVLIGSVFFHAVYLLDLVDGELARLRKATSKVGVWLDGILMYVVHVLFIMSVLRIAQMFDSWHAMFLALLVVGSVLVRLGSGHYVPNDCSPDLASFRTKHLLVNIIGFLSGITGFFTVTPVILVFVPDEVGVWAYLFMTLYSLNTLVQLGLRWKLIRK